MLGQRGYADGVGSAARFMGLSALERVGNVLFATDYENGVVRRVDVTELSNVVVTTAAGINGATTNLDGPVTTATLPVPFGLAVAPNYTMYFTQRTYAILRQIACPVGYAGENCDSCCAQLQRIPDLCCRQCMHYQRQLQLPHASSVSGNVADGCTCTCLTGYNGTTCDACATNYGVYPSCEPLVCTVDEDCSSHATSVAGTRVSGCACTCSPTYMNPTCSGCAANYENYPSCSPIPCTNAAGLQWACDCREWYANLWFALVLAPLDTLGRSATVVPHTTRTTLRACRFHATLGATAVGTPRMCPATSSMGACANAEGGTLERSATSVHPTLKTTQAAQRQNAQSLQTAMATQIP